MGEGMEVRWLKGGNAGGDGGRADWQVRPERRYGRPEAQGNGSACCQLADQEKPACREAEARAQHPVAVLVRAAGLRIGGRELCGAERVTGGRDASQKEPADEGRPGHQPRRR